MGPNITGQPGSIRAKIVTDFGKQPRGDGTSDEARRQYDAVVEATGYFDSSGLSNAATRSPETSPEGIAPPRTREIIANPPAEHTNAQTEPCFTVDGNSLLANLELMLFPEVHASSPSLLPDSEMPLTDNSSIVSAAAMGAHEAHGASAVSVGLVSLAGHSGSVPVPHMDAAADGNSLSAVVVLTPPHPESHAFPIRLDFQMRLTDSDVMPAAMANEVHGVSAVPVEVSLAGHSGSLPVPAADRKREGGCEEGMVGWENGAGSHV